MSYYYVVASLPALSLDSAPPFRPSEFLDSIEGLVRPDEMADLRALADGRPEDCEHPFLVEYVQRDTQRRNAIARARASEQRIDASPFLRRYQDFDGALERGAVAAMGQENPLDRERALERVRWEWLDEAALEAGPNSFAQVAAFVIKLRAAVRWNRMQPETGGERLREILRDKIEQGTSVS